MGARAVCCSSSMASSPRHGPGNSAPDRGRAPSALCRHDRAKQHLHLFSAACVLPHPPASLRPRLHDRPPRSRVPARRHPAVVHRLARSNSRRLLPNTLCAAAGGQCGIGPGISGLVGLAERGHLVNGPPQAQLESSTREVLAGLGDASPSTTPITAFAFCSSRRAATAMDHRIGHAA